MIGGGRLQAFVAWAPCTSGRADGCRRPQWSARHLLGLPCTHANTTCPLKRLLTIVFCCVCLAFATHLVVRILYCMTHIKWVFTKRYSFT
eukprot:6313732-Amphidinium_carterae.1